MPRHLWRMGVFALGLSSALIHAGCTYHLRFQMESVINEPTAWEKPTVPENAAGMPLEVEIVCLDHKDAERFQELARGEYTAQDWFGQYGGGKGLRDDKFSSLRNEGKVFSLRDETLPQDSKKSLGKSLRSKENADGARDVRVPHPEPFNDKSHILVFAKFFGPKEKDNFREVLPVPPVRLSPPAKYPPKVIIQVKANSIKLLTGPEL